MFRHVRYLGQHPTLRKGVTALMRKDGRVQLDGSKDGWRASERRDPRCYGWHDLGEEWEDVE